MQNPGLRIHIKEPVNKVRDLGDMRQVTVTSADGTALDLRAEAILVAMGRVPNVKGLGLEDIGVTFNARGITVDSRLRTSLHHIYAAGDVNGGPQFTHAAGYQGGIVVSNAIFRLPRKVDYTWLPWCTYTDPELASIGMNETAAQRAGIHYTTIIEPFAANDRALAEAVVELVEASAPTEAQEHIRPI